jgi:arylsulfatase A-like enzyme
VALVLTAGTPTSVTASPAERSDVEAAAATPMSIVVVLTDDQTMDAAAHMPYLNSRTDWRQFTRAFVNNSLCCPSRASILTGQYDTRTGVMNNSAAQVGKFRDSATLAVWLKAAGYRTGLFGKYFNGYPWVFKKGSTYIPPGWSTWEATYGDQMYTQYNYLLNDNGVSRSYGSTAADYEVDVIRDKLLSFIRSTPAGQPLFAYFAPTSTHTPWTEAPRHVGVFNDTAMPRFPNQDEADVTDKPAWVQGMPRIDLKRQDSLRRRMWRASLSVDDAVQGLFTTLADTGRLGSTVVIFISDNGYSFGAHRWQVKRCEYEECHHVPMRVYWPGLPSATVSRLVSNVDLASTISDIAGATPTIAQDGRSLVPLITGQAVSGWRTGLLEHWPGGDDVGQWPVNDSVPAYFGIRTSRYHYVELATGEKELYDLRTDPYELTNVANSPAYATVTSDLQRRLQALKAG